MIPIFFGEVGICLLVVAERLGLGVKVNVPAEATRDIAKMADRRAEPPDLNVGVGALAALDAFEKVPGV